MTTDPQPLALDDMAYRNVHLSDGSVLNAPAGRADEIAADMEPDIQAEARRIREVMAEARWNAAIPRRFRDALLIDLPPDTHRSILNWQGRPWPEGFRLLEHGRPSNLVILGPVGTGKTHTAVAAIRWAVFEQDAPDWTVVFVPSVELLDDLRPGGRGPQRYIDADVLVIDDLGGERPTDWTAEQLYMIVNARYNDCLPTVATANGTPAELREAVGVRLYSRLVGENAVTIGLGGVDRRRHKD